MRLEGAGHCLSRVWENNFELLEQHSAYDRSLFSHYVQQSNDIAGFKKTKPQELSIL